MSIHLSCRAAFVLAALIGNSRVSLAQSVESHTAKSTSATIVPSAGDSAHTAATSDTVHWKFLLSKNGDLHGKLPEVIQQEMATAHTEKRTLFLEVGATWCPPCVALEQKLSDQAMVEAFAGTQVLHLDPNEWDLEEELGPYGYTGGTLPIFLAIDSKGKVVKQLHGEISPEGIHHFLQENIGSQSKQAASSSTAKRKRAS